MSRDTRNESRIGLPDPDVCCNDATVRVAGLLPSVCAACEGRRAERPVLLASRE